ncbi:MAG: hypothetical protein HY760_05870 [Nitrospirae bacterium]|nr:hypothetical protein [Nitrospirota bacterium]
MKTIGILSVFMITMAFAGFAAAEDRSEVPPMSPGERDAVAVVVNPLNPARMLTTAQLREIFTRKVLGWHRVGGPHELSRRPWTIRNIPSSIPDPSDAPLVPILSKDESKVSRLAAKHFPTAPR